MNKELLNFYFSFDGRATRRDFNIRFALTAFLGSIAAGLLDFFFVNGSILTMESQSPFSNLWGILTFVSMFAVVCRRLHDMNYSGWWQLLTHGFTFTFITIAITTMGMSLLVNPVAAGVGGIIAVLAVLIFYLLFFVFLSIKRGTVGPNKYGSDPLEVQHVSQ